MVKKREPASGAEQSPLSKDFFSGKIRDSTTKESVDAARKLCMLKNKHRNPGWTPVNCKVGVLSPQFFFCFFCACVLPSPIPLMQGSEYAAMPVQCPLLFL
jgi:hypothetical protein